MDPFSSLQTASFFSFLAFAAGFSAFAFLLYVLRLRSLCDCETCTSYVSSLWRKDFDNLCDWYTHLLKRSPTGTINVHVTRNVITANEKNVEHLLKDRFDNYPKGKAFSAILGDLLGGGIFNVDGDSWLFQRKMASLELGSVSVRAHAFEIVASEIEDRLIPLLSSFAGRAPGDRVLDMQDVFRRLSFNTICRFSFGLDPGCLDLSLPTSQFATAFDTASTLSAERAMAPMPLVWKIKRAFNLGSERRLREAIKMVNSLADDVINQHKMGNHRHSVQNDLLARFLSSVDDDRQLRDIVVSFLLAGRDTVASALTSFFWLLSLHPEVKSSIREESDRVIGSTIGIATFDQLRKMHYLHAAVYECMRLYPPVQFDSKFALDDDILPDGTFIRKGTRVTYHPYAMGRMEQLWGPDCLQFRPERWLNDKGVFSPESLFKYPVFQAGARVCLGKEMAVMETKSVALALIQRFDIRMAVDGWTPRFVPGLTASIKGGLPAVIERRC